MKIAVSGKGGTGKTSLVAALAKNFVDAGHQVLAIDADPTSNLAMALGQGFPNATNGVGGPHPRPNESIPLIRMKELIAERTGTDTKAGYGKFFKLNPHVDDIPDTYRLTASGVSFIVLGAVHVAAGGCYCPENVFLQSLLSHLVLERDEVVIIDMEAGIEHLTRGTVRGIDVLVVMVEPTLRSIEAARTIHELASELGIRRIGIVGNKIAADAQREFIEKSLDAMEILGFLSLNGRIQETDITGEAVFSRNPQLVDEVNRIRKHIEQGLPNARNGVRGSHP
jgi:CO dehydrogenase maturation factor